MLLLLKIIIGLFGLGILVFVHELGHFLAARLAKIKVEAFSIGWGNPILKKKIGEVEYRLGMFPIGGYCKMKGETDYNQAWENMRNGIQPESGSFLAAPPIGRILAIFGGPFFNLVFAIFLFSILWGCGFEVSTTGNRIVLASEITGETYPADTTGLQTGDKIVEINRKEISYFDDISENVIDKSNKPLSITVERNGKFVNLTIVPSLDKSTAAGKIGVYRWIDPVIENVKEGSPAQREGLLPGDIITAANGIPVQNTMDISKVIEQNPGELVLDYNRGYVQGQARFSGDDIKNVTGGIYWEIINYENPRLSIPMAIVTGTRKGWKAFTVSIKSLALLFKGIDLTQAVSGPVKITHMMGDRTVQGFGQGVGTGFRTFINFIAIISIALCVMNLLPLPFLDGGMIILFFVEMIRKKPAHPKFVSIFNTCGMVIIAGLMFFALFGDILYFVRR